MPDIPIATGVWPKTSIKDVAESLGLTHLSDEAAAALAADVEFRLTQLIEDSIKFMRHSKRTNLSVEDVDYALRAKNIEPLWGFASTDTLSFRRATSTVGNLYFIDEEEIDLTKILAAELPPITEEPSYTAHWLAVEGVQPAIPQNPSPAELKSHPAFSELHSSTSASSKSINESQHLTTREHLSRELRLYFDRVTAAALSQEQNPKNAALASLGGDPGLHQLVPYLIQFVAEKITSTLSRVGPNLEQLRDTIRVLESVLSNPHSYLEPYLHQILPSILTCLLSSSFTSLVANDGLEREIRYIAGSLLKSQLNRYQHSYPTLRSRILKTLTKSLIDPQSTHRNQLGALIGVRCLGLEPTKIVIAQNIKALGGLLDSSLAQAKTQQSCVDDVINETLKIMSEAYSEEQVMKSNDDANKKKKLRSIPAQDELEAEVGVQFAARIMSSSEEEETQLAYTFIKDSTRTDDDGGSSGDEGDGGNSEPPPPPEEEEIINMDIVEEAESASIPDVARVDQEGKEGDGQVLTPLAPEAPSNAENQPAAAAEEKIDNQATPIPLDETKPNDHVPSDSRSNKGSQKAVDDDEAVRSASDPASDSMDLGSDNQASQSSPPRS